MLISKVGDGMRGVRSLSQRIIPLFGLLLAACITLPYVEPYDADIEKALNDYDKAVTKFIKDVQSANGADRRFDSPRAKAFYSDSNAVLSNAIVRAEALARRQTCPLSKPLATVLQSIGNNMASSASIAASNGAEVGQVVADLQHVAEVSELKTGSCTVVILRAVRSNNTILEDIHREQNDLPDIVAKIALENIEDTVRVALTNELAKKRR